MEENKEKKVSENVEYVEEESDKSFDFGNKLKNLKEKLKSCQKEKEEYLAGWQRERADFINHKKEEEEKAKDQGLFIKGEIFFEFLKILDNFERASFNPPSFQNSNSGLKWVEGVLKIKDQIKDFLKHQGVEEVLVKKGDKFDPQFCEALEVTDGEEGKVIEVLEKGYFLEKKLLRPAKVKVGKSK